MLKYLKKFEKKNIGILGGSFNPPHHGHYFISKIGIKKLNLDLLLWIITNQNPLKPKSKKNTNYKKKLSKSIIAPLAEKIKIEFNYNELVNKLLTPERILKRITLFKK